METDQKQSVDEQITELSEVIYQLDQIAIEEEECYEELSDARKTGAEGRSSQKAVSTLESAIVSLKGVQKRLEELT